MDDMISRQAAIDAIRASTKKYTGFMEMYTDDDAVEAIEALPSAQQDVTDTNVGDMINRQALCEYALNQKDKSVTPNDIMRFPSAQPERKNGHWEMVPDPYGFFDEIPVCSECGCTTEMRKTYKFCPNCGADMGI